MYSGGPSVHSVLHRDRLRQASRSTQRPIGTISPVSSANGMKSPGTTSPRSGWCQRSSASIPATWPSASRTIGW